MKAIEEKELKDLQLEILQCVHDFCQRKGIANFLNYGTLQGAAKWLLAQLIPYSWIQKRLIRFAKRHAYESAPYMGCQPFSWSFVRLDRAVSETYCPIEFEGRTFQAIADYDAYLTAQYGDYRQLPPEEERVYQHQFEAYLRA